MYFKHKIFGFIFNLFSKSKVNDNQIAFVVDDKNSFKGNFQYIKREFSKRGDFDFVFFNKNSLSISNIKKLAKSKYIFLNDNFLAIAFMNFNKDSKIFQLWHAPGAFKKFAASSSDNKEEIAVIAKASKKTDYLFITSENIKGFYRDAFRIDENKIKSFGIPRTDYYFEDKDIKKLRENFDERYPIAKNKKILLYAPTFRDNEEDNNVFNYLDLEKFNNALSEEYVIALRLHPKINQFFKGDIDTKADFIDVSDYKKEQAGINVNL